ncbi:MAG: hypothetical protein AB1560_01370 [Pseudomonadota bacterium]
MKLTNKPYLTSAKKLLTGAVLCLFSGIGHAALLGIQPGFPQANYDNQGTTTFSSMNLAVNASLIEFKFLVSDTPYFVFGSLVVNAKIDGACNVASNEPNPEITMVGDIYDPNTFALVLSGTLLTGEIVATGFQSVSATTTAIDFRFNSAGGLLVTNGYWPAGKDIGAVLTVENSSFVDCIQAFSGGAKGSIGPVDPLPPPGVGTGTQGYWKNHLSAWPLSSITVGGVTYTAADANNLLSRPPKGDQTWSMFRQLVAAMLNVANGTDPSCIQSTIAAGNAWLATYPLGSGVKASSSAWVDVGEDIHGTLDAYNNGQLCAPHRPD